MCRKHGLSVGQFSDEYAWQDICDSRVRRSFALQALASCQSETGTIDINDLLLMSLSPCLAHDTVYTVSMVPSVGQLVTRVRPTRAQKRQVHSDLAITSKLTMSAAQPQDNSENNIQKHNSRQSTLNQSIALSTDRLSDRKSDGDCVHHANSSLFPRRDVIRCKLLRAECRRVEGLCVNSARDNLSPHA